VLGVPGAPDDRPDGLVAHRVRGGEVT
jgi:hypothetical protein